MDWEFGGDLGLVFHPVQRVVLNATPELAVIHSVGSGTSNHDEATNVRVGGTIGLGVVLDP